MPTLTPTRGDVYWLDQDEIARLARAGHGLTLPPGPAASRQARISSLHPFAVLQNIRLCSSSLETRAGVFLPSMEENQRPQVQRCPWKVILEPDDVQNAPTLRLRVAVCHQVYTMPVSAMTDYFGRLTSEALNRVTAALAYALGISGGT